jgi:hypothetical protein
MIEDALPRGPWRPGCPLYREAVAHHSPGSRRVTRQPVGPRNGDTHLGRGYTTRDPSSGGQRSRHPAATTPHAAAPRRLPPLAARPRRAPHRPRPRPRTPHRPALAPPPPPRRTRGGPARVPPPPRTGRHPCTPPPCTCAATTPPGARRGSAACWGTTFSRPNCPRLARSSAGSRMPAWGRRPKDVAPNPIPSGLPIPTTTDRGTPPNRSAWTAARA